MTDRSAKSGKPMWDAMHAGANFAPTYPRPERFRGNFDLVDQFVRNIPGGAGRRLLEMGCGGSRWLPWFAREMGYSVEGVDYSSSGCRNSQRGLEAAGVTGTIHCRDFLDLGQEFERRYDIVSSFGVVEHFEDPTSVLRLFAKCLRSEGLMVTFVPNMAGLYGSLIKHFDRALFETHLLFDLEDLADFHRRAGMEIKLATYTGWADFQSIPYDRLGELPGLALKNFVYAWNLALLVAYRRLPTFRPQSRWLCDSMLVIARSPKSST
jgi:SAM-dependent methyltransferase